MSTKTSKQKNIANVPFRELENDKVDSHDDSHKGSGYKGKGSLNKDAITFNRLRKEGNRIKQQ